VNTVIKTAVTAWIIVATGSAFAQESPRNAVLNAQRVGPTPPGKVISKSHQPVGTPHKVSSFAPHRTNKRVFGDPIQAPIVHNVPARSPKKTAPR
jgi:hypothetical protein